MTVYRFDGWTLDSGRREMRNAEGAIVELTSGELSIMLVLLRSPRRTLSRDDLRSDGTLSSAKSVDVAVCRLRDKLPPRAIKTVRLGGYWFSARVIEECEV